MFTMKFSSPDKNYWSGAYKNSSFTIIPAGGYLRGWLEKYFQHSSGSVFEIGCFPGGYLDFWGNLGYELNGIDLVDKINPDLYNWLKSRGHQVGELVNGDFVDYKVNRKFDVVYSFGFLEHFINWDQILIKHSELVRPGGRLIIGAPNFRGWAQRLLHFLFDRENYYKHYLPAMDTSKWRRLLEERGFDIIFSGCIGNFDFWSAARPTKVFSRLILPSINFFKKHIKFNNYLFSPYLCLLAVKRK